VAEMEEYNVVQAWLDNVAFSLSKSEKLPKELIYAELRATQK